MALPPSPRNLVGPEVRRRRIEAGLSQEALAAKIQVKRWDLSRGGLSKIEARLRRVNDAELLVLVRALGCGIADLYPRRVQGIVQVLRQGRG
jgi:transcriptional regulator with XRE-family HTH domain